jgi:hypothetical protein
LSFIYQIAASDEREGLIPQSAFAVRLSIRTVWQPAKCMTRMKFVGGREREREREGFEPDFSPMTDQQVTDSEKNSVPDDTQETP